jgi:hypothetical protein
VLGVKGDLAKIALTAPACAQAKDKVALSRRIDKHWRLVGKSCLTCQEFMKGWELMRDTVLLYTRLGRGRTWYPRRSSGGLDIKTFRFIHYTSHALYCLAMLSTYIMVQYKNEHGSGGIEPLRHTAVGSPCLGFPDRPLHDRGDGTTVSVGQRSTAISDSEHVHFTQTFSLVSVPVSAALWSCMDMERSFSPSSSR